MSKFEDLKGKVINSIQKREGTEGDELVFHTSDGSYRMVHYQDCCESVYIEDICGDLDDLTGTPVLLAEEVTSNPEESNPNYLESATWTFYKLSTIKGSVTIRWVGESNGYYSESVDFESLLPPAPAPEPGPSGVGKPEPPKLNLAQDMAINSSLEVTDKAKDDPAKAVFEDCYAEPMKPLPVELVLTDKMKLAWVTLLLSGEQVSSLSPESKRVIVTLLKDLQRHRFFQKNLINYTNNVN